MEASDQLDELVNSRQIYRYLIKRTLYGFQGQFGRFGDEENRYQLFKESPTP